jgi:hypothetical protein
MINLVNPLARSVLAPGVLALDAGIDPRFGFIGGPGLAEDPIRFIVAALGAGDVRLGKNAFGIVHDRLIVPVLPLHLGGDLGRRTIALRIFTGNGVLFVLTHTTDEFGLATVPGTHQ